MEWWWVSEEYAVHDWYSWRNGISFASAVLPSVLSVFCAGGWSITLVILSWLKWWRWCPVYMPTRSRTMRGDGEFVNRRQVVPSSREYLLLLFPACSYLSGVWWNRLYWFPVANNSSWCPILSGDKHNWFVRHASVQGLKKRVLYLHCREPVRLVVYLCPWFACFHLFW